MGLKFEEVIKMVFEEPPPKTNKRKARTRTSEEDTEYEPSPRSKKRRHREVEIEDNREFDATFDMGSVGEAKDQSEEDVDEFVVPKGVISFSRAFGKLTYPSRD